MDCFYPHPTPSWAILGSAQLRDGNGGASVDIASSCLVHPPPPPPLSRLWLLPLGERSFTTLLCLSRLSALGDGLLPQAGVPHAWIQLLTHTAGNATWAHPGGPNCPYSQEEIRDLVPKPEPPSLLASGLIAEPTLPHPPTRDSQLLDRLKSWFCLPVSLPSRLSLPSLLFLDHSRGPPPPVSPCPCHSIELTQSCLTPHA